RVCREGEPAPAARGSAASSAGGARRHAQDEGQERSFRLGKETVEAEGDGTRAPLIYPVAFVAARRHGARPGSAQLRLRAAEKNDSGRAALGAVREGGGSKINRGGRLDAGTEQDQGVPRDAGQVEQRDRNVPLGGKRRERESGTRQPQHRGRDAGPSDGAGALRFAAPRACDVVAGSGGEIEPIAFGDASGSAGTD